MSEVEFGTVIIGGDKNRVDKQGGAYRLLAYAPQLGAVTNSTFRGALYPGVTPQRLTLDFFQGNYQLHHR